MLWCTKTTCKSLPSPISLMYPNSTVYICICHITFSCMISCSSWLFSFFFLFNRSSSWDDSSLIHAFLFLCSSFLHFPIFHHTFLAIHNPHGETIILGGQNKASNIEQVWPDLSLSLGTTELGHKLIALSLLKLAIWLWKRNFSVHFLILLSYLLPITCSWLISVPTYSFPRTADRKNCFLAPNLVLISCVGLLKTTDQNLKSTFSHYLRQTLSLPLRVLLPKVQWKFVQIFIKTLF